MIVDNSNHQHLLIVPNYGAFVVCSECTRLRGGAIQKQQLQTINLKTPHTLLFSAYIHLIKAINPKQSPSGFH